MKIVILVTMLIAYYFSIPIFEALATDTELPAGLLLAIAFIPVATVMVFLFQEDDNQE